MLEFGENSQLSVTNERYRLGCADVSGGGMVSPGVGNTLVVKQSLLCFKLCLHIKLFEEVLM